MRKRYQQWMYEWETRLTSRDTNRIVRPFEWGNEWLADLPDTTLDPDSDPAREKTRSQEQLFQAINANIVAHSDDFYSYQVPTDFRLEDRIAERFATSSEQELGQRKKDPEIGSFLRFTSPVRTPFAANDLANARWFPAKRRTKRAMVILPQWNADAFGHNALARIFNRFGISALRLSMPYHDIRRPTEIERADYAVSSNIGRTISAARQAVVDIRSCLDWLQSEGYSEFGVLGTSLGSCYAFIASSHDSRLRVNAFNHASTYFADVVWTGQSTRHIRTAVEEVISLDSLRKCWLAVSPMAYFDKFVRWPKKSLVVYAKYDLTFLPEFSRQVVETFRKWGLQHRVAVLPCGHYTTGETPYKYMDAWHLGRFVATAF